jgi:hypothetical protein
LKLIFVRDLAEWYEQAKPFVQRMADGSHGRHTEATIRARIEKGEFWLAVAADGDDVRAAMIAQPVTQPTGLRELWVWGLTGKRRRDWQHLEAELRRAAKAAGFARITATAREGWARVMKPIGWRVEHVDMSVEL